MHDRDILAANKIRVLNNELQKRDKSLQAAHNLLFALVQKHGGSVEVDKAHAEQGFKGELEIREDGRNFVLMTKRT